MNYYSEPDSHIRDIFIVVLDIPNYATKKELKDATDVGKSNLVPKIFYCNEG